MYNRYQYEVSLSTTEEARAQFHLHKFYRSGAYKTFTLVKDIASNFFVKYTVWLFHIAILFQISLEEPDVFSILLFFVDSVVFIAHLFIEWKADSQDRNRLMQRWCIPSFITIGILILFRYCAFYTRYFIGQKVVTSIFKGLYIIDQNRDVTDLFSKKSRFYRLFMKANSWERDSYLLYRNFYGQLFYLLIASLAMISLTIFDKEEEDESLDEGSEEEFMPYHLARRICKLAQMRINEDGTLKTVPKTVNEESKSLESSEFSDSVEKNDGISGNESPLSPKMDIGSRPIMVDDDFSEDDKNSVDVKEDVNIQSLSLSGVDKILEETVVNLKVRKTIEQMAQSSLDFQFSSIKNKKNEIKPKDLITHSHFLVFFCLLILQRALTFTIIVFICRQSSSILDYCYILIELVFFTMLFHNVGGEFKAFGIEEFNERNIEFFGKAFTQQLDSIDSYSKADPIFRNFIFTDENRKYDRIMVRDVEQNCFFLNQLLLRLQKKVTGLTTTVSFIKLSIVSIKSYLAVIKTITFMITNDRQSDNDSNSTNTMIINTVLMTIILIELLTIKDYRSKWISPTEDIEPTSEGIASFCTLVQSKLSYYVAFVTDSIWEKEQNKTIAKQSKHETFNPFVVLEKSNIPDDQKSKASFEAEANALLKMSRMAAISTIVNHSTRFEGDSDVSKRATVKRETFSNVLKATKLNIDHKDLYQREKKERLAALIKLYKAYIFFEHKTNKHIVYDFMQTYSQYTFIEPEKFFYSQVENFESDSEAYQEDEFDLGLTCYERNSYFITGVGTPRLLKILLLHKNKHKFHFCTTLKGILYILRRLLLIPILFIVCTESNLVNIPLLVIGLYYSFRSHKTILLDVRLFVPIFSCAFFSMFMWNSLFLSRDSSNQNNLIRPVPTSCNLIFI